MAEAPSAPAPAASVETSAPAPITSLADLDVRMAEIKANPTPPADASVQEAPPADPSRPAEPVQGEVPDAEEGPDPAKPGGRFAKLRDQLTAAEQKALALEQRDQQRTTSEQEALRQFVDLVLPDATFEMLRQKAEGGDWEAKQQLDQARAWRRMVAPLSDLAHRAVKQQFDQELTALRTLDGMDSDSHQKLLGAQSPGEQLKLAWQLARSSALGEHKERIAALEAEVATLKTNKAANGAQPAAGGGRASNGSGLLAGWLGPDGLPTEEAITAAKQGRFRDLATT